MSRVVAGLIIVLWCEVVVMADALPPADPQVVALQSRVAALEVKLGQAEAAYADLARRLAALEAWANEQVARQAGAAEAQSTPQSAEPQRAEKPPPPRNLDWKAASPFAVNYVGFKNDDKGGLFADVTLSYDGGTTGRTYAPARFRLRAFTAEGRKIADYTFTIEAFSPGTSRGASKLKVGRFPANLVTGYTVTHLG